MKKILWATVLELLGLALIGFTATRTIDLFSRILQGESVIVAMFALAALDVGLIGWTKIYLHSARGDAQRGIALLMICVDLTGVVIAFLGDMIIRGGQSGLVAKIDQGAGLAIVIALGVVIAANIAAYIAYQASDPETQLRREEEKAREAIDLAKLEEIRKNSKALAAELAPLTAAAWMSDTRKQIVKQAERNHGDLPAQQPAMQTMAAAGEEAALPKKGKK